MPILLGPGDRAQSSCLIGNYSPTEVTPCSPSYITLEILQNKVTIFFFKKKQL